MPLLKNKVLNKQKEIKAKKVAKKRISKHKINNHTNLRRSARMRTGLSDSFYNQNYYSIDVLTTKRYRVFKKEEKKNYRYNTTRCCLLAIIRQLGLLNKKEDEINKYNICSWLDLLEIKEVITEENTPKYISLAKHTLSTLVKLIDRNLKLSGKSGALYPTGWNRIYSFFLNETPGKWKNLFVNYSIYYAKNVFSVPNWDELPIFAELIKRSLDDATLEIEKGLIKTDFASIY